MPVFLPSPVTSRAAIYSSTLLSHQGTSVPGWCGPTASKLRIAARRPSLVPPLWFPAHSPARESRDRDVTDASPRACALVQRTGPKMAAEAPKLGQHWTQGVSPRPVSHRTHGSLALTGLRGFDVAATAQRSVRRVPRSLPVSSNRSSPGVLSPSAAAHRRATQNLFQNLTLHWLHGDPRGPDHIPTGTAGEDGQLLLQSDRRKSAVWIERL